MSTQELQQRPARLYEAVQSGERTVTTRDGTSVIYRSLDVAVDNYGTAVGEPFNAHSMACSSCRKSRATRGRAASNSFGKRPPVPSWRRDDLGRRRHGCRRDRAGPALAATAGLVRLAGMNRAIDRAPPTVRAPRSPEWPRRRAGHPALESPPPGHGSANPSAAEHLRWGERRHHIRTPSTALPQPRPARHRRDRRQPPRRPPRPPRAPHPTARVLRRDRKRQAQCA